MMNNYFELIQTLPTEVKQLEDWFDEYISLFTGELIEQVEELINLSLPYTSKRALNQFISETITHKKPISMIVASHRWRPKRSYYEKTKQQLPWPESTKRKIATGIELNISLCRGHRDRRPSVDIEFQIWGEHERNCFYNAFRDHQRAFEKILHDQNLSFETSSVFKNIEAYRGDSITKKLKLYFENMDDENQFSIISSFNEEDTLSNVLMTFVRLVAILDIVFGYCTPIKNKDRAFDYISSLA